MRYKSNPTKINSKGKKSMTTIIMPKIKPHSSDSFVVMVEKTRLDHLAYKFYKNPNYWWILASANDIKGTMYTELGIQLRIPRDISYILAEFNRINGV